MRGRWLWCGWLVASTLFAQPYATNSDPRLAGLVAEALERHPALDESVARFRSTLQRIPQIRALPEPELTITQFVRSPETRVGPQETSLMVSQTIPWFGKLGENSQVAATAAEVQRQKIELLKAEIVRSVKQSYYQLAYVDRAIAITEQDLGLIEHFEGLARARYSQGVGLQQAVVKLQAEITRGRNRLRALGQQRVDAEAALNTLLDRAPETPVDTVAFETVRADVSRLGAFYEIGRANRPEMKTAFLEIEKNEKRIHAAQKEFWPDLKVGAGFTNVSGRQDPAGRLMPPSDNGKNIVNFMVGIELPIRRRKYNAAVLEATEDFVAARQGYRRTENDVEGAIRSVAFRLTTLEEQISLFERVLEPQAELALQSTEAAYSTGSLGVLELLDSERTLLEVRLGLARFQTDYMKTLADMERAIGSPFPEEKP